MTNSSEKQTLEFKLDSPKILEQLKSMKDDESRLKALEVFATLMRAKPKSISECRKYLFEVYPLTNISSFDLMNTSNVKKRHGEIVAKNALGAETLFDLDYFRPEIYYIPFEDLVYDEMKELREKDSLEYYKLKLKIMIDYILSIKPDLDKETIKKKYYERLKYNRLQGKYIVYLEELIWAISDSGEDKEELAWQARRDLKEKNPKVSELMFF